MQQNLLICLAKSIKSALLISKVTFYHSLIVKKKKGGGEGGDLYLQIKNYQKTIVYYYTRTHNRPIKRLHWRHVLVQYFAMQDSYISDSNLWTGRTRYPRVKIAELSVRYRYGIYTRLELDIIPKFQYQTRPSGSRPILNSGLKYFDILSVLDESNK